MKICNVCIASKPNKCFTVNNRFPDNLERTCRDCVSSRRKASYEPERAKKQWKKNKYSSPEFAEDRRLREAYGISKKFRDYLAGNVSNVCEICSTEMKLVVDHDHTTGIVRGMICARCNRGLGHFDDDIDVLEKALEYLKIKTEQNSVEFAG